METTQLECPEQRVGGEEADNASQILKYNHFLLYVPLE